LAQAAHDMANSSRVAQSGWFDDAKLKQIVADHQSGISDHGRLIWQMVMLDKALDRLF
jgi:asparagine synthase (glutamine-hydrolysing)